jgi:hypothetical protein
MNQAVITENYHETSVKNTKIGLKDDKAIILKD